MIGEGGSSVIHGLGGDSRGGGLVFETGDVFVASTGDDSVVEAGSGSLTSEVRGTDGGAAAVGEGRGAWPHPNDAAVGDATPLEAAEVCLEWFLRARSSEIENSVDGAEESQLNIFAPAAPPLRPRTTRPVIESSSIHRLTILMDCSRT